MNGEQGSAALLLRALAAAGLGHDAEARSELRAAIEQAPSSTLVRIVAARILFVLRDYRQALAELSAAARMAPRSPAALDVEHELLRRLGWYHEALAAASRSLRLDPRRARVHERVADLLHASRSDERALRHLNFAIALLPRDPGLHFKAARAFLRLGKDEQARRAVHIAVALPDPSSPMKREAAELFVELGDFEHAERLLHAVLARAPDDASALAGAARLRLFRGDLDGAERLLAAISDAKSAPSEPDADTAERRTRAHEARRLRGALRVLRGAPADALAELDAIPSGDSESHVWRGEARFLVGDLPGALSDLDAAAATVGDHFVALLLRLLVAIRAGDHAPLTAHVLDGLVEGVVSLVGAGDPGEARRALAVLESGDALAVAALLDRARAALRGNRTACPSHVVAVGTVAAEDHSGVAAAGETATGKSERLAPVRRRPSARYAAKWAIELIETAPLDEVLQRLDEVMASYPDSSHPHCYRGELYLWMGRYGDARRDFERSIAIHRPTRWAYIGLGATHLLEGDPASAMATFAEGQAVGGRGSGPTLFAYRGEAHRHLGALPQAFADLDIACRAHPGRIGAWVNRGLVEGALGEDDARRRTLAYLRRRAAGLVHDAARALHLRVDRGDALLDEDWRELPAPAQGPQSQRLLEKMLEMLRGNRASGRVTYFTTDGDGDGAPRLRTVPQVPACADDGDELRTIRLDLERSLDPRVSVRR